MDWLYLLLGGVVGANFGSFVQAIALRCINQKSFRGRSYCPACKIKLQVADLFPIISYLYLGGKCRYCHKPIARSYILVEVVMAIIVAILFIQFLPPLNDLLYPNYYTYLSLGDILFKVLVICVLVILFIIDLKIGLLPDRITYPAIIFASFYLISVAAVTSDWTPLIWSFLSGVIAAGFFAILIILTRGKGMGWGDVKYVLFLGIALGFPKIVAAIFLAFLLGAIVAIFLLISGKKRFGQTIPFGPFLSLGALLVILWGNEILGWYFSIYR